MNHLDTIQQELQGELKRLNAEIREALYTDNQLMNRVVNTYLETKGKQIRPIMVILSAKMFGEINDRVFLAGEALEMLHNASLIHDDIIDETAVRRGSPTINATWGNHIAVLVGDYFVSNALALGIRTGNLAIISALSNLGRELSLGEIDQITNARWHHFTEEGYYEVISKKTASLFLNCVRMGAEAVDASEEQFAPMLEYARLLGLCFQIRDDIFDYYDDASIGKPTGNDLREGKVTLPLIYALHHAPAPEAQEMKTLLERGALSDSEIATLIDFAKRHGGIDYAYDEMRRMQREAHTIISQYPESAARTHFETIFEYIILRKY